MTSRFDGDKPAQIAAKKIFPLLVQYAQNGEIITYGEISEWDSGSTKMSIRFTHALGVIGEALLETGKKWKCRIPPLTVLVIGEKGNPGSGANRYLAAYIGELESSLKEMPVDQRQKNVEKVCRDIFAYKHWDRLLEEYGMKPLKKGANSSGIRKSVNSAAKAAAIKIVSKIAVKSAGKKAKKSLRKPAQKPISKPSIRGGRSDVAESEEHKALKDYIANRPHKVGLAKGSNKGEKEYPLPTHDEVDVVFKKGTKWLGVEVKARISNDGDIERGVYQCVKYQALLRAMQKAGGGRSTAKAVLVVERKLSPRLKKLADNLKVDVFVCPVKKQE